VNLTPTQKKWLAWALVALVVFGVNTYLGVTYPIPEPPDDPLVELGTTHFTNLEAEDITATDDLTVTDDAAVGGDLTVTGAVNPADLTTTDDIVVGDDLTVAGLVSIGAQTAISVTAGAVITPTGSLQPLTSAAAVTCSTTRCIENGATTGDILILKNDNAADAITIDGTGGNVECKADVVLGAGDTIILIWGGSDWYCLSVYDNS